MTKRYRSALWALMGVMMGVLLGATPRAFGQGIVIRNEYSPILERPIKKLYRYIVVDERYRGHLRNTEDIGLSDGDDLATLIEAVADEIEPLLPQTMGDQRDCTDIPHLIAPHLRANLPPGWTLQFALNQNAQNADAAPVWRGRYSFILLTAPDRRSNYFVDIRNGRFEIAGPGSYLNWGGERFELGNESWWELSFLRYREGGKSFWDYDGPSFSPRATLHPVEDYDPDRVYGRPCGEGRHPSGSWGSRW